MKITLIDYTGNGNPDPWHAANVLIFTKQTRLKLNPGLMDEIKAWPEIKKLEELEYMSNTIPSSWEFVDYCFLVEDVPRSFTHQFVRSRHWSFAQQTMRVLEMEGWDYATGPSIKGHAALQGNYDSTMAYIARAYTWLIRDGAKIEDARGVLPTDILTNIVGKCNMRTFVETAQKRASPRTQDAYRQVFEEMKKEVMRVHPWMHLFINRTATNAIEDLQENLKQLCAQGMSEERHTHMTKLLDQLRMKL